ncbi:hypothetical protein FA95DRAFT_1497832 [Auriscalpium vulgare]|uniref:Uncharacterized protein n=1 Tax=Auriscalpium vulgare TaxID=40419 RepID=A0ACB8RIG8_9AGAM|nr:hypothetical protein FA95DRAFT_1497832 [Auriscalpium vulgare]
MVIHLYSTLGLTNIEGYILACLVQACVTRQADSSHPDPIHVTNYFLRGASIGPYEVHMRTVRAGKSFTNMTAELIQEGSVKLSAHLMFGVLDPALSPPSKQPFELLPPDAHARPTPFHTHPSLQSPVEFRPLFPLNFRPYLMRFEDPSIVQHHERLQLTGTGPGGRERGSWYRLPHAADTLTPGVLAFFADVFEDTLPPLPSGPLPLARFPTLLMSVEFKAPIPRAGGKHCTRTVGSYTACRFVNEPLGRHNIYLELWTAPAEVEAGRPLPDGWRDEQRCLLIANHMSLVGPVEVGGHRNASFEKPRL